MVDWIMFSHSWVKRPELVFDPRGRKRSDFYHSSCFFFKLKYQIWWSVHREVNLWWWRGIFLPEWGPYLPFGHRAVSTHKQKKMNKDISGSDQTWSALHESSDSLQLVATRNQFHRVGRGHTHQGWRTTRTYLLYLQLHWLPTEGNASRRGNVKCVNITVLLGGGGARKGKKNMTVDTREEIRLVNGCLC